MQSYLVLGSDDKGGIGALKRCSSAWSRPDAPVTGVDLPNLKIGSFEGMVRLTDEIAKADANAESLLRRIERTVGEADKEIRFEKKDKEVRIKAQSLQAADGKCDAPESEAFGVFHKVKDVLHGGKALYRSRLGVWLYFEGDCWYVDDSKFAGEGCREQLYLFKGNHDSTKNLPTSLQMNRNRLASGSASIDEIPITTNPPLGLETEERVFQISTHPNTWKSVDAYMSGFKWAQDKFPTSMSVPEMARHFVKVTNDADENFKAISAAYNDGKAQKTVTASRATNSYGTTDLVDVFHPSKVENNDLVNTEHLTTVCIILAKGQDSEFANWYEGGGDAEKVIPRSFKALLKGEADKDGMLLFRVIVFRETAEEFVKQCKAKYGPNAARVYEYSVENYFETVGAREAAAAAYVIGHRNVVEGGILAYSDAFMIWAHLKLLRVIVEGTLRFGKGNVFACFAAPNRLDLARKDMKMHISAKSEPKAMDQQEEGQEDYHGYVSLNLSPLSISK